MPKGMLEISDQTATLITNNTPAISKHFNEIVASYCLLVGSDVLANDSTCFLLQFTDQLWLIPEDVRGSYQLKRLLTGGTLGTTTTIAKLDHLPPKWRRKLLFIPGVDADIKCLPLSDLSKVTSQIEIIKDKKLEDII
jgi:hypothetical protein